MTASAELRRGTPFPLPLGRGRRRPAGAATAVMGILNVTPDSFSDGGGLPDVETAVAVARSMLEEGAEILDVGGESTRPGADPVDAAEELRRVVPVIRALTERLGATVSVDTSKAEVFEAAWAAGASMLNDVRALSDADLAAAAARTEAAVVLMHGRGGPKTMATLARYDDVTADVARELGQAVARATAAGVDPARIALDPGLGFAKTAAQSWRLLADLDAVRLGRFPLVVGPSRKSFLGAAVGRADPRARDAAGAAIVALLARRGAECVRMHDAGAARDAVAVAEAWSAAEVAP
ncbi:MAG TPA: dihydropteroate synthase [Planctomycetota bacterium]|nr:dihydropteroate synthase [Planctomycetota bacterium]